MMRSAFSICLHGCVLAPPLTLLLSGALSFRGACGADLDGIEGVYDDLQELRRPAPLVCVIDTQHPDTIRQKMKEPAGYFYAPKMRRIVTELSGLRCVVVHYSQITRCDVDRPNVKALMILARSHTMGKACDDGLFALIRKTRIPTIGFCGGYQIIAQAYGAKVDFMRDLRPGEADTNPDYSPGKFKEWGFQSVRIVRDDPLFQGIKGEVVVREMHSWEIKELPDVFDVLCATDACKIQAIKHREKVLYGTQFHAEHYDDAHPDGRTIIENFFRIAGIK